MSSEINRLCELTSKLFDAPDSTAPDLGMRHQLFVNLLPDFVRSDARSRSLAPPIRRRFKSDHVSTRAPRLPILEFDHERVVDKFIALFDSARSAPASVKSSTASVTGTEALLLDENVGASKTMDKSDNIINILKTLAISSHQRTAEQTQFISRYLLTLSAFKDLIKISPFFLIQLSNVLAVEPFDANRVIFSQGDVGICWYIVIRGCVSISLESNNKRTELTRLHDGDGFGNLALINDLPRAASAIAVQSTLCLRVDKDDYNRLLRRLHSVELKKKIYFMRSIPILQEHYFSSSSSSRLPAITSRAPQSRLQIKSTPLSISPTSLLQTPADNLKVDDIFLRSIAGSMSVGVFAKNAIVFGEGSHAPIFFIVKCHSFSIFKNLTLPNDSIISVKVATLHRGDCFGEFSVLVADKADSKNGVLAPYTVISDEDEAEVAQFSFVDASAYLKPFLKPTIWSQVDQSKLQRIHAVNTQNFKWSRIKKLELTKMKL